MPSAAFYLGFSSLKTLLTVALCTASLVKRSPVGPVLGTCDTTARARKGLVLSFVRLRHTLLCLIVMQKITV